MDQDSMRLKRYTVCHLLSSTGISLTVWLIWLGTSDRNGAVAFQDNGPDVALPYNSSGSGLCPCSSVVGRMEIFPL